MSKTTNDQSSLAEQDDDSNTSSSSVVIDASDILPSYNHEKIANSVVEQFFYELKTHDDGTKSAKCLLCHSIVKQSTTSTYNYGRHVYRKHMKETNKWKLALDSKKSNKSTKQSTVQQSFGQRVATIAKLSHKSTLFAEHLQRENISIPLPVKTRWNSQHHTICKVLEISLTLLNDLLRNVGRADLVLTARDIIILQEFASIFALFAEATTRTQIENSASISLVAPSVLSIYYDLEHEQANCKYLGSLCRTLIISLHERFGGLLERCEVFADSNMKIKKRSTSDLYKDDIYLIAPFLDGRFKLKWVVASNLSESTKERTTNIIKALLFKAALQLHGTTNNTSDCIIESSITECSTTDDDGMSNLPNFKRKRLFSGYEGQKTPMQKKRSCVSESIENEISMFEKELLDDTRLIFLKKDSYPYLHRLATRVLCVPATSAPVERVFSSSGILMRPHRSRLSKNMLSILTLLKCNRKLL
ncbi:unnamed protein product [Rotaria socialis]|uniref:HAT C-terminal dimerisation domain-containing protein n=1 Tax=Rotaria socialis TaxID=392032 RepID=A0A821NUA7_9BILA|nr:unnamed protein product [Rotaria socialis]